MAQRIQQTEAAEEHGLNPWQYVQIGVVLTVITVVELAISLWVDVGRAMVPMLIVLSAVKFAGVVAFYMHLRFDSPLFTRIFVGSLALGAGVLLALFTLFGTDITDAV